ncbi:MAG: DNA polymerase Y family protein [Akkermansiaceae bacterium]
MYAALHFPDLALYCLLTRDADLCTQPAALLSEGEREKSHLVALNGLARKSGLARGMRTTHALARCADLVFLEREPETEQATIRQLSGFAESLTPDFELTSPESILLDLSTIVFSTSREWTTQTLREAVYLGLPLQIATAPIPDLAHLCSLSPRTSASLSFEPNSRLFVPEKIDPGVLTLPEIVSAGTFPLPDLALLDLWGVQTLADLSALPRQGLAERLGPEATLLHDIFHQKTHRLLQLSRASTSYQAKHFFETPVENFEPILFVARRLFQTLCNRLRAHQRATSLIEFSIAYDNGAGHSKSLRLSEPTLDPDILLRTLHTHLNDLRAPDRTEEFHLKLEEALPGHKQHEIFRKGLKDPHQFADTVRRLSALVGHGRLGIPQLQDSHRPDAFTMFPVSLDFQKPEEILESEPVGDLPMSRFRPPIPIQVMTEKRGRFRRPLAVLTGPHQGRILQCRGPFPLSGNWWDRRWQEMQWDVELEQRRLFQLTEKSAGEWLLSGIYGG